MMGGARYGRGGLQSICITALCTRVDFDRRVAPVCAPLVHADGAIVCPLPLVARLPTSSIPPALPASWTLVALYLARCFELMTVQRAVCDPRSHRPFLSLHLLTCMRGRTLLAPLCHAFVVLPLYQLHAPMRDVIDIIIPYLETGVKCGLFCMQSKTLQHFWLGL